jgi:periplasmic divalent cation tolerance protein
MEYRFVYMTMENKKQAREIGKVLVEERLVACVNIIDGMNSMYRWKGKLQDDNETVLIAKTKASLVPEITERVKKLHSYDVPCVVSLQLLEGNQDFLDWIGRETK